jgi:hypothetical protein
MKSLVKLKSFIFLVSLLFGLTVALAEEPDSKKIPKSILMLGLYCNAANNVLEQVFQSNPSYTPWRATGIREMAFKRVFSQLDFNGGGNVKAVRDGALTQKEVDFLVLTAKKDATLWGQVVHEKCGFELDHGKLEHCLRDLNSEIYKCYLQLNDQVEQLIKSSPF